MPASIEKMLVDGVSGRIELALDWPAGAPQGIVYVGHPHPLYGGTFDNKVVATIARTFAGLGWLAVRPNFRGVGGSAGEHDEGEGETEDFLHLIDALPNLPAVKPRLPEQLPIAVAGFSFGSFVAARSRCAWCAAGRRLRYVPCRYPWRCLCLVLVQITRTTPDAARSCILSQIRLHRRSDLHDSSLSRLPCTRPMGLRPQTADDTSAPEVLGDNRTTTRSPTISRTKLRVGRRSPAMRDDFPVPFNRHPAERPRQQLRDDAGHLDDLGPPDPPRPAPTRPVHIAWAVAPARARPLVTRRLRPRQDVRAVGGHGHRVLEVRRQAAVLVTAVHPSASTLHAGFPMFTIGSMASTMPSPDAGPRPRGP